MKSRNTFAKAYQFILPHDTKMLWPTYLPHHNPIRAYGYHGN